MSSKSKNIWRAVAFLSTVLAALAFIAFYMFNGSIIRGTITYDEDARLPGGSSLVIQLRDISSQDAPGKLVEELILTDIEPPINFSMSYDRSAIDPASTYSVIASIYGPDDSLLWSTDGNHQVITRDAPRSVEIELVPIADREDPAADDQLPPFGP